MILRRRVFVSFALLAASAGALAQTDPDVVLLTDKLLFSLGMCLMFALGFLGGNYGGPA